MCNRWSREQPATPRDFRPQFSGRFQTTSLRLAGCFWHVNPCDSYTLKLAGCSRRQCALSHPSPYQKKEKRKKKEKKGWRKRRNAMLSWSLTKGDLPAGGYESRGGFLPVDFHIQAALDFKAKLSECIRPHRGSAHGGEKNGNSTEGSRKHTL